MNKPCFLVHFETIKPDTIHYRRMGLLKDATIVSDVGDVVYAPTASCPVIDYTGHKFRSADGSEMILYFARPLPQAILHMIHEEALMEAESYKYQEFIRWFDGMSMERRKNFVATVLGWRDIPINDLPKTNPQQGEDK